MNEKYKTILQVVLVVGIVTLASLGVDGWGWLIFALLLTL
jgi:hypothetical protein